MSLKASDGCFSCSTSSLFTVCDCRSLQAAQKDFDMAKFNVGYCYHTGELLPLASSPYSRPGLGTDKNAEEAMRWYKEAAGKGQKLVDLLLPCFLLM